MSHWREREESPGVTAPRERQEDGPPLNLPLTPTPDAPWHGHIPALLPQAVRGDNVRSLSGLTPGKPSESLAKPGDCPGTAGLQGTVLLPSSARRRRQREEGHLSQQGREG